MTIGLLALLIFLPFFQPLAFASHYLPKPGERPLSMRVSTCAVSGGFVHLYTALDNGLFDKYGLKFENIFIRGSAQNLTALATDEVQFTYCAADGTIPALATGIDVKLVASPLVKLPYVLVARKEIRRPEDLKGKSIGIARAGDLSDRLSRAVVKNSAWPRTRSRSGPSAAARASVIRRWRRNRPGHCDHPAIGCTRQERRLQCALSLDRSGPAIYLQ